MAPEDGDLVVTAAVARLRRADLGTVAVELPGAVCLIVAMHPEVRWELIGHGIADALGLRG